MIKEYLKKRKQKKIENKRLLKEKRKEIGIFREYFELITEVLIYVFFVMTFLLQSFVIPTPSMVDTILVGDHLLVNKVAYSRSLGFIDSFLLPQEKIKRNMIVTFKAPHEMKKEYVKRVIGLPGDLIRIENQKIFINEKPFDDKFRKFRADYPEDKDGKKRLDYKERQRFLVVDGVYIHEQYRWYGKSNVELIKDSYYLDDKIVLSEIYKVISTESNYNLDSVLKMEKELISSKNYPLDSNFSKDKITESWIRDSFPLDINGYEFSGDFNKIVDYSTNLVKKNGKNYFKVPKGHYFCIGDNRDHSYDSRFWGPVPEDYILGKPWRIYWSYDADDYLKKGIGNKIKGIIDTIINFFSKTRWERTGKRIE